ncbi:MAG: DUF1778 domain-containing protein [Proteobacteria bacterium]|nr:DUF1778 domain-containing protein [Pseudomonadota bacterium]
MKNAQSTIKPTRNVVINLRANRSQRELLDRAAHLLGKNRSDFLLETACREAETVLLDQRLFVLDESAYHAFLELLEAPISPNEKLEALHETRAPWELT